MCQFYFIFPCCCCCCCCSSCCCCCHWLSFRIWGCRLQWLSGSLASGVVLVATSLYLQDFFFFLPFFLRLSSLKGATLTVYCLSLSLTRLSLFFSLLLFRDPSVLTVSSPYMDGPRSVRPTQRRPARLSSSKKCLSDATTRIAPIANRYGEGYLTREERHTNLHNTPQTIGWKKRKERKKTAVAIVCGD